MSLQFRFKKQMVTLFFVFALSILTISGCAKKAGEKKLAAGSPGQSVILNEVAHSIFYAPMYVAIEEGYFSDAGINLELVTGFGAIAIVQ